MGEAKTRMMGAAAAAAMIGEAARPSSFIRAERCETCKHAVDSAAGLPPGAIACHGAPPSTQAVFDRDGKGNMVQIGQATSFPVMRKDDPNSFCAAWKPRILS